MLFKEEKKKSNTNFLIIKLETSGHHLVKWFIANYNCMTIMFLNISNTGLMESTVKKHGNNPINFCGLQTC